MDRRRFLKYAGLGVAIAGSALAGYELNRWQTTLVPPSVSTVTQTLLETTTETLRLSSLHGRLFFDYNGNGVQDGDEPAVAGALVQLKDGNGEVVAGTLSDSSGDYRLEDVGTGPYRLHIGVEHFSDKRFGYMCRSTEEFTAVSEGYDVLLDRSQRADIGLMEGFLTLPLDTEDYLLWSYVDLDHKIGTVRNFSGDRREAVDNPSSTHARPGTSDQHQGVDYSMPCGRNVLAMAPGVVLNSEGGTEYARYVRIIHEAGDEMFVTDYGHNSKNLVGVGDVVKRGQIVALSGDNNGEKKTQPHVHINFWEIPKARQRSSEDIIRYIFETLPKVTYPNGDEVPVVLDPYRDEVDPEGSRGYWTKDSDPQYAISV